MKKSLFAIASFMLFAGISANAQTTVNSDVLDINNIRATINANGRLFGNMIDAPDMEKKGFEIKNTNGKHAVHIAGIWMGGKQGSKYHIYAPTFGQWGTDIFPGPVMKEEFYTAAEDQKWNRVWKVNKEEVKNHIANFATQGYIMPEAIMNWPASGDIEKGQSPNLAPFVDANGNGIYDPEKGDYPSIKGDEAVLFIFNDHRGEHTESHTWKMGVEVIGLAYAFHSNKKAYDNTVFVDFTIINRSGNDYSDAKLGVFTDIDLGANVYDEYAGIDVQRNTYYGYNADESANAEVFGRTQTPYMSVTLLTEKFNNYMTYNNDWSLTGNPYFPEDYYHYLNGFWRDGMIITKGGIGKDGTERCEFMYDGNPFTKTGWNEKSLENVPGDRRGLGLVGPFEFKNGAIKKISVAYHLAGSFNEMQKNVDRYAKDFAYNTGPFAPETPGFAGNTQLNNSKPVDIILFPNPAKENATLIFSNHDNETYNVMVYDITGRMVFSAANQTGTRFDIAANNFERGVYVVELAFKNRRNSTRLVVQ